MENKNAKIDKEELHSFFEGIKNNNQISFKEFYKKYRNLVYGIAFSILKDKENSEDVVQNVFIKIWNMQKSKLPKEYEATWLYKLTKNETLDFLKTIKLEQNIDELYYISDENNEINKVISKEAYNRIIQNVSKEEQEIISLKIVSDLSFKQISQILNIPIGTVKWAYYKSIHTLKLLLANLGMFIVTFVIGLKTLLTKQENITQTVEKESNSTQNSLNEKQKNEGVENLENHSQNIESVMDSVFSGTEQTDQNNVQTTVTGTTTVQTSRKENFGIGFLSISAVFLIFTIVSTNFLIKYKLKRGNKSSK